MRIAQCVQHAFQRVIRFPVIVDGDADDVLRQAAAFRRDAIERQQKRRCDMQPLRLAADPKAGLIQMFHRRSRHMIAHGDDEASEPCGAGLAHAGNGRRRQIDTEQIGHQFGQTLLGQQLEMQQINDERRDPRAILNRRRDALGKSRARLPATGRAAASMGAVFGDRQRPGLGQIEHLAGGVVRRHRLTQRRTAIDAALGEVIDRSIRRFCAAQRCARMAFLAAGLLAGPFA